MTVIDGAVAKFAGIEKRVEAQTAEREFPIDPNAPVAGRWYWVRDDGDAEGSVRSQKMKRQKKNAPPKRWLACCVHLGSNYALLEGPGMHGPRPSYGNTTQRVHFDDFNKECTFEPNAEAILAAEVEKHRRHAAALMGEVQKLTAQLAITMGPKPLSPGVETAALAMRGDGSELTSYKKALVKAQTKTLPTLFEGIKAANAAMGGWMQASLIPFQAQLEKLEPLVEAIKGRIFNVELYAGLTEEVAQVRQGKPAGLNEPLHLFQRRAYMDEECLLDYQAGGMELKDIEAFDEWLGREKNLNRLLPHPRCGLAFQVRRNKKDREWQSLMQFINTEKIAEADKLTFLYLRNGEQLFRLSTTIDFGETLFPEVEVGQLTGALFARRVERSEYHVINENALEVMRQEEARARADLPGRIEAWKRERQAKYEADLAAWNDRVAKGLPHPRTEWGGERKKPSLDGSTWDKPQLSEEDATHYHPFTDENLEFDDIAKSLKQQMDRHNRLVLVLQGLFDRSPVLHPHPTYQLWTEEGFSRGLRLIYDVSRALNPTEAPPDFEAYRARCNASLKVGSITIGQREAWWEREVERENTRRQGNWRYRGDDKEVSKWWRGPDGNPGPGIFAKVTAVRGTQCRFDWEKQRQRRPDRYTKWSNNGYGAIPDTITVDAGRLFNVSAYRAGDFVQFFEDHRTRAEYLKWAPLLLRAEDFLAGKGTVGKEED